MKHKGFTIVEAMICLLMITILVIVLCRFSNTASVGMANTSQRSESFMQEYQDVLSIRSAVTRESVGPLNNEWFTLSESNGQWEVWEYSGEYIKYSRMFGG